ncbi:MAG: flagellar protein export ATPase FliI [Caulobacterales bacterium]|nr:flagellar protein export ATPase FliI [Caulobacterales bacterium]
MRDLIDQVEALPTRRFHGRVDAVRGLLVEAVGPAPALALGAQARIDAGPRQIRAEIVGFRDGRALMMPFDSTDGVRAGAPVLLEGEPAMVRPSRAWLGRVVNAFAAPIDGGPPLVEGPHARPVRAEPPSPNARARLGPRLDVGVRALNAFVPVCLGQRLGLFAGSGVGKSMLMGMMAKNAAADVIVIGLIGERGREVREFIEDVLGPEGLARAVVIVATSDESALARRRAADMALATAEHFRDEGASVLCLIDSVTRIALAQREIGLAAGEPPTTRGYTPSVFAELPRLLERAGPGEERGDGRPAGSITALFTVLVEGGDMDEPVADAVRGILDGHVVMERAIAERGRYPAINILKSVSRSMPGCCDETEWALISRAKSLMAAYADMEELIRLGAYARGTNPEVDAAIDVHPRLEEFLAQRPQEAAPASECFARLAQALEGVV